MIDHVSIAVSDLETSARFYDEVLKPLGYSRLVSRPATIGFGKTYPEFWLNARPGMKPVAEDCGDHVCLRARDEAAVRAFHEAALSRGARDDGAPGPRRGAMSDYFGAFIRDPDGHRIEVVTFPRK